MRPALLVLAAGMGSRYGRNSFQVLARHLQGQRPHPVVGFILKNTLSEFGSVARGLCCTTPDGFLESVTELTRIEPEGAAAKYTDSAGQVHPLTGTEIVSMNMWGFGPAIFAHFQCELSAFLQHRRTEEKAEVYIPSVVNRLVNQKQERVQVLRTPDSWLGVTYREDRPRVIEGIRHPIARGDYPENLWGQAQ